MAITKPTRSMLSTGVSDSSDATFLTADSSENATFAGNLTVSGNLTVTGTSTTVDTVTMNAQNAIVFEGATADAHETTLTTVDPTGDRTISLPNASGTLSLIAGTETLTNKTLTTPVIDTITRTGDFTVDASGDIILDADGEQIRFKDAGTEIAHFDMGSQNLNIRSKVSDKDILFYGNDGGSDTLALTLDMSAGGAATFTSSVDATNFKINGGQGSDGQVLTSTGSGVAWEDAAGGATSIDGLSDATTSETNSIMLGTATHGSISGAAQNTSVGIGAMDAITSAEYTVAIGYNAATALTSGSYNTIVGGNALLTCTDGHSNTAIGMSALKFTTSGDYNTAVGRTALQANTTADGNTAVGYRALLTNETGASNTSVGIDSLRLCLAKSYNTAVGKGALEYFGGANANSDGWNTAVGAEAMGGSNSDDISYSNAFGGRALKAVESADYNNMFGYGAGTAITTGSKNTGMGHNALSSITAAEGNVAIGVDALKTLSNTGAHNNVAIGRDALKLQTTATDNIAIGAYALDACNSASVSQTIAIGTSAGSGALAGYGNVFIGYNSGQIATSAFENTFVGRDAGSGLTTGDYNVCVGAYAGKQTNAIEGGVHNVFIGYKTRGTHPSHSQAIAIGSDIDAAPGQVAIGTSGMGKTYNEFNTDALWSNGSDVRLKQHINDSTLGLDFINDLRPVTYNWKPSNELPKEFPLYNEENQRDVETIMTGLIAQEVKTAIDKSGVARFAGWGEDNDGVQQIRNQAFIFPLINAVQELSQKVADKDGLISALEKRIETIEQRLI